jgi:iron complex outermembrane receptor protein
MASPASYAGDNSSKRPRQSISTFLLILIWGILTGTIANAQQELEEIIVTAERREQSLQDLPIAATVFSGEDIVNKGIDRIHNIQQFVPNVAINTYNRSTFVNIRGVGLALSAPASNPGVAFYIDGVYVPKEQHIAYALFDIESMEVLRGPQGTLTGQNSTGGAIYARSVDPSFDSVSGYVDQTIASDDWYRTTAAVNLPLGEKVAVRLAAVYEDRGSFTKNIGPSLSEPGSSIFRGLRAKMAIQASDAFRVNLDFDYFDSDTDYNALKNRDDQVTSDPFVIEEDAYSYFNQDGYRASAELIYDTPADIRFRLITSIHRADQIDQADGDRTATAPPVPAGLPASGSNRTMYPGRVSRATNEFDFEINEVNLLSTGDSRLQWVLGAFYMNKKIPLELYRDNYHTRNFIASNSDIITESELESYAVFGQINYQMTDAMELIAGLRWSEDDFTNTRFALPGPPPPGGFPYADGVNSSEVTGRIGLNYSASDNVMWYGTIAKGYKPGATNLSPGFPAYSPETNLVYEAGFKSTLMENRVRFNAAVFFSKIEDFQLLSLQSAGGPLLPTFQNGTEAESKGVELEMVYAYDQVAMNLAFGYLDATFSKEVELNNAVAGGPELVPDGRSMPFAPEWNINAGIQYDFPMGNSTLTPRFQVSHIGEQFATPFPSDVTRVPSRTVADFRLIYSANERLRIEGFVNNVFDETYVAAQIQNASSADGGMLMGPPLQYGVRLSYGVK